MSGEEQVYTRDALSLNIHGKICTYMGAQIRPLPISEKEDQAPGSVTFDPQLCGITIDIPPVSITKVMNAE